MFPLALRGCEPTLSAIDSAGDQDAVPPLISAHTASFVVTRASLSLRHQSQVDDKMARSLPAGGGVVRDRQL
ncbi:hypothetical protein BaRGS_00014847 [Batillaria attramentaria]|uniref:Uncharacterized protein n=1 Tax=Batillaria attramentaria TaxID=370345 RepID=A0ABD0L3R0_9CAEN